MKTYLSIFILLLVFSNISIAQICPDDFTCVHGTCVTGACVCEGNWTGADCSSCAITCSNSDGMYLDTDICECTSIDSQSIPTISQWGLIVLGLILSLFGLVAVKSKKLKTA